MSTAPELLIEIPPGNRPTRVYWTQFNEFLLVCFEDGYVRKYDPKVRRRACWRLSVHLDWTRRSLSRSRK